MKEKRREEKKEKKKKKKNKRRRRGLQERAKVWKSSFCMASYGISMVLGKETKIFVWIVMGWCEFVDFYMKFLLELGFEVLKSVITC